jgi:fatty-acyl-CoA synthase
MTEQRSTILEADQPTRHSSPKADWVRALQRTASVGLGSRRTLGAIIDEVSLKYSDHSALIGEVGVLTYSELSALSRRYSRWALARGLQSGDRVGLMMENGPDYIAIWIGLSRIGVVVALLSPRLVGASLLHCIDAVALQHLIVEAANLDALALALGPASAPRIYVHGAEHRDFERIDLAVRRFPPNPLGADEGDRPLLSDVALLIFTSGTTGMPKAAFVSHYRIVMWSEWFAGIIDARAEDRLYNCLPLCHSVGGVVGVGSALVAGASVIVRRNFSATRFWADAIASRATIFLYIGELCRYLLTAQGEKYAPPHHLRLCIGNGLRSDVWEAFVKTFAVPRIIEFYASTEGSFSLFNLEGKPGAIGRTPPFLAHRSPVALVKFDFAAEHPLRSSDGHCFRCAPHEVGEALGKIEIQPSQLATRFEGYVSPQDTERKILHDVFVRGDAWFRTGDLMKMDGSGFFYFVDRIGDTFRWKGENVSTSQVAATLSAVPGVLGASVYDVEIPFADGRAGMAALAVSASFDMAALRRHVHAHLPSFARPLFLRLSENIHVTDTFKPRKLEYKREGYNPSLISDRLFIDDVRQGAYRAIDEALYGEIRSNRHFDKRPTILG